MKLQYLKFAICLLLVQIPILLNGQEAVSDNYKSINLEKDDRIYEKSLSSNKDEGVIIALKTNLLYDLCITPNIELEIPIGNRWSINAEFQYAWWIKRNTFCWELASGGFEGRYWLGDRNKHAQLTGWFVGAFAGAGLYDFQLQKDNGYQGEFYIMMGGSAGYCKPIGRNLNLEFSLGAGAFVSDYKHYRILYDELVQKGSAKRNISFMPLKAKVSLVWLLRGKNK